MVVWRRLRWDGCGKRDRHFGVFVDRWTEALLDVADARDNSAVWDMGVIGGRWNVQ